LFLFLAVAKDHFLYQNNNTSCGVELAHHSMGTGRPPDLLYDLGVHLTTCLHLVPPVRTIGDILPMPHINKWLNANKVIITSASLDTNCLN